jgi:leucyl-tRNA synthetase
MEKYNHKEIEKKWQKEWEEKGIYNTKTGKDNEYILVEFAYPSGNLHVGHWYAFAVTDIYARYRRMIGHNVMFPIGFDAFGLPAENAAIKNKTNPRDWTYKNMEHMETQLKSMGSMFDWDRKVITSDPEYYKWTQWLFIQLFNKGLVYQAENLVNWCPSCKTVLANEQVVSGKCDRCDSEIEQREMKEWKIKTTEYADRLIDDLDSLDWPEYIKEAQKNWIGRSHGTHFTFEVEGMDEDIKVFTTRADTFFGITYITLAPENKLLQTWKDQISNWSEVEKYIKEAGNKTELERISDSKEKTGVKIEGIEAIHPGTGEKIPVFISDYVIASYGTGAVMAVPAHDQRDFEFAEKFGVEKKEAISGGDISKEAYTEKNTLINSDSFDGLTSDEAIEKITEKFGEKTTNYKIRDWSVSRQRYWGCPIPLIHCDKCGVVADENLPVELPDLDDFTPRDDGKSPLAKVEDFVKVKCPKCDAEAQRETDTLDTFVDSSWYFLRYCDSKNSEKFADKDKLKNWMPVGFYSGGSEHTTMHLLYARFFHKALFDLDLVNESEPFAKRLNRGLILGEDGNKMSKSKGNVIDPDEIVERLGADTVRAYLAFIGPYNEPGSYPWDPNGVVGTRRFIERIVSLKENISESDSEEVTKLLHKTIKSVGEDYQALKFNTGISKLMILSNLLEKESFSVDTYKIFLKLLAPVTPFACEELWNNLSEKDSIHLEKWPEFDEAKTIDSEIELMIQVNGKMRGKIRVSAGEKESVIIETAKNSEEVKKWLEDQDIKREIYVKGRLVNFVV